MQKAVNECRSENPLNILSSAERAGKKIKRLLVVTLLDCMKCRFAFLHLNFCNVAEDHYHELFIPPEKMYECHDCDQLMLSLCVRRLP